MSFVNVSISEATKSEVDVGTLMQVVKDFIPNRRCVETFEVTQLCYDDNGRHQMLVINYEDVKASEPESATELNLESKKNVQLKIFESSEKMEKYSKGLQHLDSKKTNLPPKSGPRDFREAACDNCLQTNEHCQQVKNELEVANIKVVSLEKKVEEGKKELETRSLRAEKKEKELQDHILRQHATFRKDVQKLRDEKEEVQKTKKKKVEEMEKQMKNMKKQAEKLRTSNKTEQEKAIAELEDLQKQLSDLMKINEEWSNNYRDLSLLSSQKDLTIHKLQRELAAAREPPKERISVEMRRVLADLQDKSHSSCKLVTDTRKKVMRLIHLPTRETVKQMARDEEAEFLLKHTEWEQAINKNIAIIQGNVHVTQQDLVPVPETPGLSELLENELVIAEKKNESMGKECLVCREEKSKSQKLFKCPHCPTTFHSKCIHEWVEYEPKWICPVCYKKLNSNLNRIQ